MKETKDSLITSKNMFLFGIPLEFEVEKEGKELTMRLPELNICTTNITKFAELFESVYFDIEKTENFSEEKLKMKRFFDKLEITVSKVDNKKKKKVNSRSKGARGERFFIDELKKRFFPHLKILRTPGSGAFSTTHNLKITDDICLAGDIFAEKNHDHLEEYNKFNEYIFEIKNYKTLPNFLGSITYLKEPVTEWIDKENLDCENHKKKFIILFRSNRSPSFAMFRKEDVETKPFYKNELMSFKYKDKKYSIFLMDEIEF